MAARVRVTDPLWVNRALSASDTRQDFSGLLAPSNNTSTPFDQRAGVLINYDTTTSASGMLRVVQASPTPNMTVVVSPGRALIPRAGQGSYLASVDSAKTLDVAAADSINGRKDIVVLSIRDLEQGDTWPSTITQPSGQLGVAFLDYITGTPAGSPVQPATPANSILLAVVTVAAGATSVTNAAISLQRKGTAPIGGIRPLLEADTTADAGAYVGELRDTRSFGNTIDRWDGSNWGVVSLYQPTASTNTGHSRYYRTSGQELFNDTATQLAFPIAHSTSAEVTANGSFNVFTLNRSGIYHVSVSVWSGSGGAGSPAANKRELWITPGGTPGTTYAGQVDTTPTGVNRTSQCNVATTRRFAAGDTLSAYFYHFCGSSIFTGASEDVNISITYIRP